LPQTAGLAELDNANNIKTSDYKISSSTEPTTAPTTQNNTATNIDIDNGYVDLSNRPEFKTIMDQGDDLVQVRHHTTTDGLSGIKSSRFINASRGEPFGVDVEVSPFLKPSTVNMGQLGGGAKGGGGFIEFTVSRSQLITPPTYLGGTGNAGRIVTGGAPFNLSGTNPTFVRNWWPW